MCIAIYQAPGQRLDDDAIVNGWMNNPDGGGFSHLDDDNNIVTFRSLDLTEFEDAYWTAWDTYGASSPFIVHMRWGTTGSNTVKNCHPFPIGKGGVEGMTLTGTDTVMIHNGIININVPKLGDYSDTRWYAERYLSRLPDGWLDDWALSEMVGDFIGSSKLVFLTVDEKLNHNVYIINERQGFWNNKDTRDIWYSNSSCKASSVRYYNGAAKKYTLGRWDDVDVYAGDRAGGGVKAGSTKAGSGDGFTKTADGATVADRQEGVTPNEYLRARYPTITDEEATCQLCKDEADPWTGVCTDCGWCIWCDDDVEECVCMYEESADEWPMAVWEARIGDQDVTFDDGHKSIYSMTDQEIANLS